MREVTSLCEGQPLFLAPRHYQTVLRILCEHVPEEDVWAFGSRASGRYVWRFSDLDLAVAHELGWDRRGRLLDAFDMSNLPIRVDIVELSLVDKAFAERIRPDFIQVQVGSPAALAAA
jgi:predicted nucleotidyltransferase